GIRTAAYSEDQPLRRFAFGSCNYSDRDQSYWRLIGQDSPQLWIWLGDNIYGDAMSMAQRQQTYRNLKNNSFYASFRSQVPIIGTWDDHDFASDNKDGRFPDKLESKLQLIDFLDISRDTGILDRSGVYQSYTYGPVGQRTKVILLDLRYNQDPSTAKPSLLGESQWAWFSKELQTDDFELLVIGSSLSISSPTTGFGLEGWNAFGYEKQRLYQLLAGISCPTLILSGDRHQADIAKFDPGHGRQVFEFMSSGLTHSTSLSLPNPFRISPVIGEKNYGIVDIDWNSVGPNIRMQIKSPSSKKVLAEQLANIYS
ncbi:MAG: alkaline phosphatase D family protein, partial [Proteobacteria bacterium]|nr:alkaline phosphatase D family protein [Pseudomonadota bacterium]